MTIASQDAASGLRIVGVDLGNCTNTTLKLDGYPDVQALGKDGERLDVRTLDGLTPITGTIPEWTGKPGSVVVPPGGHAGFVLAWRNTYDDITHPPVNAPQFSVAVPPDRTPAMVPLDGGLDLGSTGKIAVSPWLKTKPPSTGGRQSPSADIASPAALL